MSTKSYTVRGMTCDHCAAAVRSEVEAIPGVAAAHVDLPSGRLDVTAPQAIPLSDLRRAVTEAGYELESPGENPEAS